MMLTRRPRITASSSALVTIRFRRFVDLNPANRARQLAGRSFGREIGSTHDALPASCSLPFDAELAIVVSSSSSVSSMAQSSTGSAVSCPA